MLLPDFMAAHGLDDEAVAEKLRVSRSTISRVRRGVMRPSFDLAVRLFKFTHGLVTPNDLLNGLAESAFKSGRPVKRKQMA